MRPRHARLLHGCSDVSRPAQDAVAVEVTVHVTAIPDNEELTARDLAQAAVEAVANAVNQAEQTGSASPGGEGLPGRRDGGVEEPERLVDTAVRLYPMNKQPEEHRS